jgi:hypothetical protein
VDTVKGAPRRLKTWRITAVDDSPEGEGVAEFVVAAADKSAARSAFVGHGLRGIFGPPAITDRPHDVAVQRPGVVFKLDYRSGAWSALDGGMS